MLFYYTRDFFGPLNVSDKIKYFIINDDLLDSYKERFVIFSQAAVLERSLLLFQRDCLFSYFFSYEGYQLPVGLGSPMVLEEKKGIVVSPIIILGAALKQRRGFLLQFGQRRVCTRVLAWFVPEFWSCWPFDGVRSNVGDSVVSRYAYRHLAQSDLFLAGVLLGQPNLYFFVYLLANPYFWGLLQQTLNSQYRYR